MNARFHKNFILLGFLSQAKAEEAFLNFCALFVISNITIIKLSILLMAWSSYFKSRWMGKKSFDTLWMIKCTMADCSAWRTYGQFSTIKQITGPVTIFCCFVNNLWSRKRKWIFRNFCSIISEQALEFWSNANNVNLVKCGKYVIGKLYFGYSSCAGGCKTNTKS